MADKSEEEKDYIEFKYEAALDRHGVIDGRELAAKLIDDAFSLLAVCEGLPGVFNFTVCGCREQSYIRIGGGENSERADVFV